MVVHVCNPSTREVEVGGRILIPAILGYTARPSLKRQNKNKNQPGGHE
jgi:hypothetical protein